MTQGTEYVEVKKVYSINIVYFDLGQGVDYVYRGRTRFIGLHENDELQLSQAQRATFGRETVSEIFPEYYILKVNRFGNETKDTLDEWIYFFKTNKIKEDFHAKGLDQARIVLDRDKLSPAERKAYDAIRWQRSNEVSSASSARNEGKIEGKIEGIEEGREEGRKERDKLAKELEMEREERKKQESELEKEREERKKRESELEKEREERKKREGKFEKEREALLAKIAKLKQDKRE
jgi:hypothetical protein